VYYDKAYRHKTDQRTKESVFLVSSDVVDAERNAQLILSAQNKI
jgi:hypothetical protein